MLDLWSEWTLEEELSPERQAFGKRASAQRSVGPPPKLLSSLHKIKAASLDSLLWVMLEFKVGEVPALADTGAQFSCVRSDVPEFLYLSGEPCDFSLLRVLFIS